MEVIVLLIIVFIVIVAIFGKKQQRGKDQETWVSNNLQILKLGSVIDDITLQVSEDKTSQIDHLLICRKGIFIIETKGHRGTISGWSEQQFWTQTFNNGKTFSIYNPVKQNATHTFAVVHELKKMVTFYIPVFSYVIFTHALLDVDLDVNVGSFSDFRFFYDKKEEVINDNIVKELFERFTTIKNDCAVTHKQHLNNIRLMENKIENNICPRCNRQLVLRSGKYGDFYGCSNYPKCKFTKKK